MSFLSRLCASLFKSRVHTGPPAADPIAAKTAVPPTVVIKPVVAEPPLVIEPVVAEPPVADTQVTGDDRAEPTDIVMAIDELNARRLLIDPVSFAKWASKAVPGTLPALEDAAWKHGLTDPDVLEDWLGQMYVESAGFSVMMENLNYSVEGLMKTFSRARISAADCDKHGRKPGRKANQEAIANIVYGGVWGKKNLGNTEPTDGWDFRGAGYKQITGRYNQEKYEVTAKDLQNPGVSADVAAKFFVDALCVAPAKAGDVRLVTKRINGGYNGLDDRIVRTIEARKILL